MKRKEIGQRETDLVQITGVIFKRKFLIIIGTALITLAVFLLSMTRPTVFRATGILQFNREPISQPSDTEDSGKILNRLEIITLPEFKRYSKSFSKILPFGNFLSRKNVFEDRKLSLIKNHMMNSRHFDWAITPVLAFSEAELRIVPQVYIHELGNYISQVRLRLDYQNPEETSLLLQLWGEYIKDVIIYRKIHDYISHELYALAKNRNEYRNLLGQYSFEKNQLNHKLKRFNLLMQKYGRVNETKGDKSAINSLLFKIMSTESNLVDIDEKLAQVKRQDDRAAIKSKFLAHLLKQSSGIKNGKKLLSRSTELIKEYFGKPETLDIYKKEIYHSLRIDFGSFTDLDQKIINLRGAENAPFVIGGNRGIVYTVLSFFLSLLFFIFIAFLAEWWIDNKKEIIGSKR